MPHLQAHFCATAAHVRSSSVQTKSDFRKAVEMRSDFVLARSSNLRSLERSTIPDNRPASVMAVDIASMRKLIAFDDDTFDKLKQLARDRMATFQELADEAFADLLKKHGIPIDLKDALRKSVRLAADTTEKTGGGRKTSLENKPSRKAKP